MKLYRLTEVSPSGVAESVVGWFKTRQAADKWAHELGLERIEITPFDEEDILYILTRSKIYD